MILDGIAATYNSPFFFFKKKALIAFIEKVMWLK